MIILRETSRILMILLTPREIVRAARTGPVTDRANLDIHGVSVICFTVTHFACVDALLQSTMFQSR